MNRLDAYIFRQLMIAFVFAGAAVTFVILFTQSFRLLSLVIDNSSTLLVFFQLMALSIPTFLPLILPLGLGVATLFVYHKLAIDSELVVMRSAGISPLRQAGPALVLAGIITIVAFILTLWVAPAASRTLVALQYEVRGSYAVFLSRPGNFNDITDGLTFYAHKRGESGTLEGILIHDVRRPENPVTIMADTGQVIDNNGQPQIVIFKGRRQEMDVGTGKLSELAFEQYVLDLNALRASSAPRLADPREQTITQLLYPSEEMLKYRSSREHLMAELHQRLASPFLTLTYTLIGLACVLAGEFNRRGMSRRILIAAFAIIAVQTGFMSMNGIIARHVWMTPALYMVAILSAVIAFGFINLEYLRRRFSAIAPKPVMS